MKTYENLWNRLHSYENLWEIAGRAGRGVRAMRRGGEMGWKARGLSGWPCGRMASQWSYLVHVSDFTTSLNPHLVQNLVTPMKAYDGRWQYLGRLLYVHPGEKYSNIFTGYRLCRRPLSIR